MKIRAEFPEKLSFLNDPFRYKVAHGGRGSAKSWSFARALLIQGAQKKLRILCTREVQKTVKDSVHKLLSDQIEKMGLGSFYEVLETIIRGKNGTEFLFAGLANQTSDSLKSLEGIDRVWCEEAHSISKKSWDVLIPTIRAPESEIWVTFNPVLDTDETYRRFVLQPPPNSMVVEVNYHDNPWFPAVLEAERIHCKATETEDTYNNIWEGKCRSAIEGAIYANEISEAYATRRVGYIPYDPALKVHTVWDLGFADHTAVIMAQRLRSEVRIIDYLQVTRTTIDKVIAMVMTRYYNWGYDFLPHDGFAKERKVGMSDAEILEKFGRRIKRIPNNGEEERIKAARGVFHRICFDREKTVDLVECLKRYHRPESKDGKDASPVHNAASHGSDATGYMCQVVNQMTNEEEQDSPRLLSFSPLGNMGYIFACFMIGSNYVIQNLF